jgi:hypothetical protein
MGLVVWLIAFAAHIGGIIFAEKKEINTRLGSFLLGGLVAIVCWAPFAPVPPLVVGIAIVASLAWTVTTILIYRSS